MAIDLTTGALLDAPTLSSVRLQVCDPVACPACGATFGKRGGARLSSLRAGAPFLLGNIIPELVDDAKPSDERKDALPAYGKQVLTFTDSRQGTARLSAKLQGDAKRNYIRALVYHFVQDAQNAGANAPILAEAPITQETITYRDNRAMATREQAKRSMRYLIGTSLLCALVAALQIVQLIIREPQHPCVLV